ncbi:MAG: DUF6029 family protein [candidate division WOR-3 bacterium]
MDLIFIFFLFKETGVSGNLNFDLWRLKYEKMTPSGFEKVWGERYFANINIFPYLDFIQGDFEIRYINSPFEIGQIYGMNMEKIFRKNIKIEKKPLKIEFFDIYKDFGKNLFAGFVKDEAVLLERFLKGFSGNLNISIFDFGFTYGRPYEYLYYSFNPSFPKDTLDEFKISEFKINPLPGIKIGAYHAFYDQNIFIEKKRAEFLGFNFNLKGGIITIYEEYSRRKGIDKLIITDTLPYDFSKGFANYTQIIFSIKEYTISGEYEKYSKYSTPYAFPPSIHPYGISLTQGRNEEGYALNFLFPLFLFDFDVNLSKSFFRKDKKIEEERINLRGDKYPFLFDFTFDNAYLKGAEIEEGFPPKIVQKRLERNFKVKLQYSFELISPSFGIGIRKRNDILNDTIYKYTEPSFDFEILHKFGFLSINYSKDKNKKDYYFFETMFQIKYNLEISLSYGKQRGEIKCSGGICRYEPPFEGFKTKISYSF